MPTGALYAFSVFLIAFAGFWSAYILGGQKNAKALYTALLPAACATMAVFFEGNAGRWMCAVAIIATVIAGYLGALYLSERNYCVSAVTLMIALSLCMSAQLVLSLLSLSKVQTLLVACACLLGPLFLYLAKVTIFPNDYILTREQKKNFFAKQIFFFPGLALLLAWQVLLLSPALGGASASSVSSSLSQSHALGSALESSTALGQSVYLVIFTLLLQIVVLVQLKQQVQSLQERIENIIDKQYQADLLSFMQVIRSQRHDFNFHTQTIYGMIENGQFDECKDYVSSMMTTVKVTNDILPLYQPATSALLNTFREMALQKGLQMDIEIHDNLQFIASPVFETNTILGNLLQNAIDELELHPENESRVIKLLIIKRGSYNIIKVSNQCHLTPEEMSKIFMPGFTTKRAHEGLGLANALRVAEKYDGTVYPEFEGRTVHFIARLPLR